MMRMNKLKLYDIKFSGLKNGRHTYTFNIDNAFFEIFDFDEFNSSNLTIGIELIKNENLLEFSISTQGFANVPCDVTGENFDQQIEGTLEFIVKFGNQFNDDNESLITIPYNAHTFNIAQQIYESILLNVPSKRIHPDFASGKMKTENLNYIINYDNDSTEQIENETKEIDPRWEALKKILTDKKK